MIATEAITTLDDVILYLEGEIEESEVSGYYDLDPGRYQRYEQILVVLKDLVPFHA